jgi:hypothetical protein
MHTHDKGYDVAGSSRGAGEQGSRGLTSEEACTSSYWLDAAGGSTASVAHTLLVRFDSRHGKKSSRPHHRVTA